MKKEQQVLAANASFYDAFAARDLGAMDALWARRAPVACIHPGWQALNGRREVIESWKGILEGPNSPRIACERAVAHVLGDSAFVVCVESLPGARLVATNVFVLEDAEWRLVHHHAGPAVRDLDEAEPGDEPSGLLH